MLKKTSLILFFSFLICLPSFAETIYLKNGKTINGKITEKTNTQVKINVNGIGITYYADEIERIDGGVSFAPLVKPVPSSSPSPANKRGLILSLIDSSGARENMNTLYAKMLSQGSAQETQKLREAIKVDDIIERLVPVYDKYFTEDELKGLIAFYQSPLGKKLLRTTPMIMQDGMAAMGAYLQENLSMPDVQQ
ncbi:MAG: DUF2059 domain-containing protein [Candidatus Omnitrophota bacterium]